MKISALKSVFIATSLEERTVVASFMDERRGSRELVVAVATKEKWTGTLVFMKSIL